MREQACSIERYRRTRTKQTTSRPAYTPRRRGPSIAIETDGVAGANNGDAVLAASQ